MKIYQPVAGLFLAVLLSACGGGDGGGTSSPTPTEAKAEGAYFGTASNGSQSKSIQVLILEDDTFWILYGTSASQQGFLQGQGASSNGSFTSSNAKDFGVLPAAALNFSANYTTATHSLSGTTTDANGTVTLRAGPLPANFSYNYNTPANITEAGGAWSLTAISGGIFSINISNAGAIGGTTNTGCKFSGNILPRPSGKNIFNLTINMGAAPCEASGQALAGIAILIPTDTGGKKLSLVYTNSARTMGGTASGQR